MARDNKKQFIANYGGFVHDFGYASFSTTDNSVEVDTVLNRIIGVTLTAGEATANAENIWLNETNADGGIIVDDDGQVTVGRTVETGGTRHSGLEFYYHFIGID